MGFDLFGVKPVSKKGQYFRNNVWWWRPLAAFVVEHCDITDDGWFCNNGLEVSATKAGRIADTLDTLLRNGAVRAYETEYRGKLRKLPDEQCHICNGTGVRDDDIIKGTCNACNGKGTVQAWERNYPFSETNVREFVEFCRESGGFTIC